MLTIIQGQLQQCLKPDSGVSLASLQQMHTDTLVPVITFLFEQASTGARPHSLAGETLQRMVYESKILLPSLPFLRALCQSLHILACQRWCDKEGVPDEKAPEEATHACHEARMSLLKCCSLAFRRSHGGPFAAYWCQVAEFASEPCDGTYSILSA